MGTSEISPAILADKLSQSQREELANRELKISESTKQVVAALNAFRAALYGYSYMWDDLGASKLAGYQENLNELGECIQKSMEIATQITGEWIMAGLLANDFTEL